MGTIIAAHLEPGDTIVYNGEEREVTHVEPYGTQNTYIELGEFTDVIVTPDTQFLTSVTIDQPGRVALYTLGGVVAGLLGLASMATTVLIAGSIIGYTLGL